ncbi:hypothetical protein NQ318_007979 [Aromia moschata]|uniref:Uncharacterized protein n=1 Tax=Aromia moschata TaxID=1265417 RepID=A0AAV8YDE4_9CUCU|nr:hypothetical protein NQ318_007979 [Aromia moschata]
MKKKRGWVKGRARGKPQDKKQLTLPDLIKNKLQKDSESESLISEKSDEEAVNKKANKRERIKTRKEDKAKRTTRISTEEDSSAEADDEMENDELPVPKDSSPTSKYKYSKTSPSKDKVEASHNDLLRTPIKNEKSETAVVSPKNGTDVKLEKPKSPLYSTTSESELEIDGQKIKTISHKEVIESTLLVAPSLLNSAETNEMVPTSFKEEKIETKVEVEVQEKAAKESETTFERSMEIEEISADSGRKSTDMEIEKFDDDNKNKIIVKEHLTPPISTSKKEEVPLPPVEPLGTNNFADLPVVNKLELKAPNEETIKQIEPKNSHLRD